MALAVEALVVAALEAQVALEALGAEAAGQKCP